MWCWSLKRNSWSAIESFRKQVGKHKSIALDNFSCPHLDGAREHWRLIHERVKFPVLAARVDSGRQSLQQAQIVLVTGKRLWELRGVHAGNLCFHARGDHIPAQLFRRNLPDRKQRFEAAPLQLPYSIVTDLLKKQVSESDRNDSLSRRTLADGAHPFFVFQVRAGVG